MHTYTRGADMEGIGEVSVHADINRLTEPMMWTPRILSVLALLSSLTRPLASAAVWCGVVWCVCVCVCVCVCTCASCYNFPSFLPPVSESDDEEDRRVCD